MNHAEIARQNFYDGYNCAQAVFLAFCDLTEMDRDMALRLSSSMGGGMGRLREVCGAVSAILMTAGILYGYTEPGNLEVKKEHYARVQELAHAFAGLHGSIVCRDLLKKGAGADDPTPQARTEAYYASRPCARCVYDAAAVLDAYIACHPIPSRT